MAKGALSQSPVALEELLDRLAREIGGLAQTAREMPIPMGLSDAEAIVAAQKQDLLEQTLDDLSLFLRASAESVCSSAQTDMGPALGTLRLSALAARLAGGEQVPADETGGDLDLF